MFSKILIQFLCLSFALIEIKGMVRLPDNENEITYEKRDPEPNEEEPEHPPHHRPHHHHGRHHRHHHHHDEHQFGEPGHMPPPPPPHEMLVRVLPLLRNFLSKDYHKDSKVDATDDSKLEAQSKARAVVVSKFNTKYTETIVDENSKVWNKVLEQNGETGAIIDFNSDMDIISDKTLKAKSDEDSKPIEEKNLPELPKTVANKPNYPVRKLRRMKRSDDEGNEQKKTGDKIGNAFKALGEAIKEGFKKHVEEPVKKFVAQVKTKVDDWQKEKAKKKAKKQGQKTDSEPTEAPNEEPTVEETHEEK